MLREFVTCDETPTPEFRDACSPVVVGRRVEEYVDYARWRWTQPRAYLTAAGKFPKVLQRIGKNSPLEPIPIVADHDYWQIVWK